MPVRPGVATAAGAVVGGLLTALVVASGVADRQVITTDRPVVVTTTTTTEPLPAIDPAVTDRFLASWERALRVTSRVERRFVRRFDTGESLASDLVVVQRGDDRLRVGGGGVSGVLQGRGVSCSATATEAEGDEAGGVVPLACSDTGPAAGQTDAEVADLAAMVVDDAPERLAIYVVTVGGGDSPAVQPGDGVQCFTLVLRINLPAPPYGRRAAFCFSDASGVMVASEVVRDGSVDVTVATSVRLEVTDDDLVLPSALVGPQVAGTPES